MKSDKTHKCSIVFHLACGFNVFAFHEWYINANASLNGCLPDWLDREFNSRTPIPMLAMRVARTVDLLLGLVFATFATFFYSFRLLLKYQECM